MFHKLFLEHPETVNENYFEHFKVAGSFSLRLAFAAIVCLVHAVVPSFFTKTGSEMISALHKEMVTHRVQS